MTAEERERERALKAEVSEALRAGWAENARCYAYALSGTDARLEEYAGELSANPGGHNLYELLALSRFFRLLDGYEWDAGRVQRFFRFYEALRFSGTEGRRSYRLTPVQCFQFASIFGFRDAAGCRLTREAYIFVPRKFSKTTGAASLAVWDLLFGDSNAQAYVGANSYQQAKICFDEIRHIMRDLDPKERHFRVNREKITFRANSRDSSITCLSGNARTQDGLNASLVIMDEYAQARDTATRSGAELKNVLTSSMGARREPLTVVITTASDVTDGAFAHELDGVKRVLRGEAENDSMFAALFQPDADDREDDPATWAKVQPHLGVTVQPDFYAHAWAQAQLSAENMMVFRTKLLNVFSRSERRTWFTLDRARGLLSAFDIDRTEGHPPCAVAFDLSVRDDFSAVTYTIYDSHRKSFFSHTDYYFPRGSLRGHDNEQLYRRWVEAGHLRLCEGDRIDVRLIAGDILRRSSRLQIIRIGYDAYKSQELVAILSSAGAQGVLQSYPQTYGAFNLPVESLEMLAYDAPPRISLNANPINAYCLTNCLLDEDRLENKKPVKIAPERKIDGTITLLMTLGQIYSYQR